MTPSPTRARTAAVLLPLLAAGCAAGGKTCPAPCTVAVARLAVVAHHVAIPMTANGQEAEGILDTGAAQTILTQAAAERLDARAVHDIDGAAGVIAPTTIEGVNGGAAGALLSIPELTLAGGRLRDAPVYVVPALRLGDRRLDGLIGADLLQNWDLDLDIAAGVLRLDEPQHTPVVAPWHHATTVVPFESADALQIRIPVTVDGHRMEAVLDTGAPRSFIDGDTAAAAAVLPTDPAGLSRGVADIRRPVHRHHYADLSIGGLSFGPIDADVATGGDALPGVDMLLGLNALRMTRVYIAWQAHELLIDEGGP